MSRLVPRADGRRRLGALLLGAAVLAAWAPAVRADEAAVVESFLSRLGLVDLQILHLEKALEKAGTAPSRQQLARRLSDLYAERLITTADDPSRYDEIMRRIQLLLNKVPQANTPALQVMLLQADYRRAESLFNKWIDDPGQAAARDEAQSILARIAPQLERYQQDLFERLDKLQAEIDRTEDEDALAAKEREAARLNGFASRAAFFSGWSNYYFGLSKGGPDAGAAHFSAALKSFRRILGIAEEETYDEVDVEWLGLENIHRANALVGLGLTEAALGNLENSRACFRFLQHVSAPPTLRDHAAYWFLRGLLNTGQIDEAAGYAQQQVMNFAGRATQGKVAFCVALVRAGFAAAGASATPQLRRLGQLGVQGLARLGQFGVIRQLMEKHNIELPKTGGGFYITWIRGQQQFVEAERTNNVQGYQTAAETFRQALGDPQAGKDFLSAAQCQYALASCLFRLGQFESAAESFTQAAAALKQAGSPKAADAAWYRFHAYYELSKKDRRYLASAIDALKAFKRDFPTSEQAQRADFILGQLQQSAESPEASIRTLSQVKPGDPNFLSARAKLCLLYHQQWLKRRADKAKAKTAAADVFRVVDQYLKAAKRDADAGRKLKCILAAVDVALRSAPADLAKAGAYLAQAEPLADQVSPSSAAAAEYHYQRFQVARQQGDEPSVRRHASWLVHNARGSVYERSAIITMAKAADESVAAASASQLRQRQAEAARTYGRLVQLLGDSQEAIAASKNARVANSRLAHYQYETGQYEQAAARLQTLLAVFPKNKDYLRRAGLAQYQAGHYAASLQHWRTLLAGVPRNSAEWYEAKYYQLACLARTDQAAARKVYRQFKLLYPSIRVDGWREKFNALDKQLSAN